MVSGAVPVSPGAGEAVAAADAAAARAPAARAVVVVLVVAHTVWVSAAQNIYTFIQKIFAPVTNLPHATPPEQW